MAATRLRKTFRFQDDDSDSDDQIALDEQEQEALIEQLKKENDDKNDLYRQLLLIAPCLTCLVFLVAPFYAGSPTARSLSVLSITSLSATAYNLILVPVTTNGPQRPARLGPYQIPVSDSLSPAQKYLPALNAALSALIALWGLSYGNSFRDDQGAIGVFWMVISWTPLLEYLMIQLARRWIIEVDPMELEGLKYQYKGA